MFSGERTSDTDYIVVSDPWAVRVFKMDLPHIQWLWTEMSKYRTLFSDTTAGDVDNFIRLITLEGNYWFEVVDVRTNEPVGVVYITDIQPLSTAEVHVMFFDRKLAEKAQLCRTLLKWAFTEFCLHRITAIIPDIYYAAIRLAERAGFQREACMEEAILIGGKRRNLIIMRVFAHEV